jgi:hypothetical protein
MENSTNVSVNPFFNGTNSSPVLPHSKSPRIARKPLKRVPVHQVPEDISSPPQQALPVQQPTIERTQQQQQPQPYSVSPLIPEQPLSSPQQQQKDFYAFPSGQNSSTKSFDIIRTPSPASAVPLLPNQSMAAVGSMLLPAEPQNHVKSLSGSSFDFNDPHQQLNYQQPQPNLYTSPSPLQSQQQQQQQFQQQPQQTSPLIQQQQQILHTRTSSVASQQHQQNRKRISSRFNSISSRSSSLVPTITNDFNTHSNVSGSFYVHELRRRSATSWCDIPASVWGVPIGIAENAMLQSNNGDSGKVNRPAFMSHRRTMDIRHSHLTPRLLASEATEDESDVISLVGDRSTPGIKPIDNDTPSIKSNPTNPTQQQQQQSQQPSAPSSPALQHKNSAESVKSLEQGFQRIKLFVANPDSDSD